MAAIIPIAFQIAAAYLIPAGTSVAISSLIIGGAALLGGFLATELFGRDAQKQKDTEVRGNYTSTERTIPIVYGKRVVGTNDVFVEAGTKGELGDNGGSFLWVDGVLCEGEIEGINQVEIDKKMWDEIYIGGVPLWKMEPEKLEKLTYWFYSGTGTQTVNEQIHRGTRKESTDKYTDALRHVAHIVFRFERSKDGFSSIPRREMVLKGKLCFDTRSSVTAWTTNPAIILYDYITNSRYGLNWGSYLLYEPSFNETATYCDAYEWELNYVIASSVKSQTINDTILGHFRGALYWSNALLYLRYLDLREEIPVFTIEDQHVVRDKSGKAMVGVSQPSRFNIPEGAIVSFTNSRDNWVTDRIVIGERLGQTKAIDFVGFIDRNLAHEMGIYVLERQRLNRTFTFVLRPDTVALDTNDLIQITVSELALTQQLARVKTNDISGSGLITITAILEAEELYDKVYDPDTSRIYNVDFPSIDSAPPTVEGVYVLEETYFYRDRSFVRLNVYFSPPSDYPWFSHVDVSVGFPDPETGKDPKEAAYLYRFPAYDNFSIDPVEESQTYHIRLNSVSTYDITEDDEDSAHIVHTVLGVFDVAPPCPTYLDIAVNLSSVDIISNVIPHPDISGYEIRLGSTWFSGIFIIFRGSPSVSFSGVKPGTHKFWLNTKHKNGIYCPTPVAQTALIEDPPPGSHEFLERPIDYLSGSSTNMDVTSTTLTCAHNSGNLVGEFVTDIIDTGNLNVAQKMLVYALFGFSLSGGNNTWNDLAPPLFTWYDFAYDSVNSTWKTWQGILGDTKRAVAAKIEVGIDYSTDPNLSTYNSIERLELLSTIVTGRYIRIRYKITDINNDSYITIEASTLKASYLEDTLLIDA